MILYHYTCAHAAPKIAKSGRLWPYPHPMLPQVPPIVWLTDLTEPDGKALGLPRIQGGCNRTQWRVTVDVQEPLHWPRWARRGGMVHKHQRAAVEANDRGALIVHWWLVLGPVPILNLEQVQGVNR